jgi:hypothetical protein
MQQLPKMISPKPIKIDIPFPFHSAERKSRVCVFAKDSINGLKDQLAGMDVPCIAKVIGFDKLKRNFK